MSKLLYNIKKIFVIATYSVKQRIISSRVICLIIVFGVFIFDNMSFSSEAADLTGLRVNPLLYPFFASDIVKQLIIFGGVIFLYSDAPFIDKSQPYVIIRSKRTAWAIGQIIHIIMFSALYFFILMVIAFFAVLPSATFALDGWGQLVKLMTSGLTSQLDMNFLFPSKIMSMYSPFGATVMCFLLNWAAASFFGTMIFMLNLNFGKMVGPAVSLAWMLMDFLIENYLSFSMYKISPLSLSRLSILDPEGISSYPSPTYAFCFYGIGIVIFSAVIIAVIKNKSIEISTES